MSERERLASRLREIARPGGPGDRPRILAHALENGSETLSDDEAFTEAKQLLGDNGAAPEVAERTSWAAIDLEPVLAGDQVDEPPTLLTRADDKALFYASKVHDLHGEPETCKGWIVLGAVAQEIVKGNHVGYIDFEDDERTVVARLRALGIDDKKIQDQFHYVRPNEPLGERAFTDLEAVLDPTPSLVVLDGITEAMNLEGLSISDNNEVATWQAKLPRWIRDRTGAAVVGIDHVVKDPDSRRRWALGAGHKLAGVDVAYSVRVLEPFGRGLTGKVQIKVTKDRPGHVRRHAKDGIASEVRLTSDEKGGVTVELLPPDPEGWRPSERMEAVSRYLEANPGATRNAIREWVPGRAGTTDSAVGLLVDEGFVRFKEKGQARLHFSVRPYRKEGDSPTGSELGPDDPDPVPRPPLTGSPQGPPIGTQGPGCVKGSKEDPEKAPSPNRVPVVWDFPSTDPEAPA